MDAAAAGDEVSSGLCTAGEEYVFGPDGEVTGLRLPNRDEATPEDISADAAAWATSSARDQRACFVQNHKHDCTATCVKYQKKKQAAESTAGAARPGQKVSGTGVPPCRFRFYTYVELLIEGVEKFVMRRGKKLVPEAFVATGSEENEYGRATPVRTMPFISKSRTRRREYF